MGHRVHMISPASGVGEPPPPQQPFKIQRIALLNWKNGTKTLLWQAEEEEEEVERRRRRPLEEEEEGGDEGGRGHLYAVWCVGNALTCRVRPNVIRMHRHLILIYPWAYSARFLVTLITRNSHWEVGEEAILIYIAGHGQFYGTFRPDENGDSGRG